MIQKSKVSNYVISLANAEKRRAHIRQEFSKQSIPFVFFDALSQENQLQQKIDEHLPLLHQAMLGNGEKGCLVSHLMLWKKCIDEELPYISIFEDDILLGQNAHSFLAQDEWLKVRFDFEEIFIIKLETFLMPVERDERKVISPYAERHFNLLKSPHFGTAGYIISNAAAKYLFDLIINLPLEKLEPIDELIFNKMLFDTNLVVYQLNPALCVQELQLKQESSLFLSQIETERKAVRKMMLPKKTFKEKMIKLKENISRGILKYKRKPENKCIQENKIIKFI